MTTICVIGGSRYFGKLLVLRLRDAGHVVTVLNRGSSPPPPGITQLVTDRDDEDALRVALGDRTFDVVLDQVCYTPRQAAIVRRVFGGRTGRYVMTSTIEVYDPATADAIRPATPGVPVTEDAVDPGRWPVDLELPWHDREFRDGHYAEGKRQAEAVFAHDPAFPFVAVRSAHVLGADDFTGRLDHYVQRIRAGEPIVVHPETFPSSFINDREIADFLSWAAGADFLGPINARSHGELTVAELCGYIPGTPLFQVSGTGTSPFSFDSYYGMDNTRAARLGFTFSSTADWLPRVISEARGS